MGVGAGIRAHHLSSPPLWWPFHRALLWPLPHLSGVLGSGFRGHLLRLAVNAAACCWGGGRRSCLRGKGGVGEGHRRSIRRGSGMADPHWGLRGPEVAYSAAAAARCTWWATRVGRVSALPPRWRDYVGGAAGGVGGRVAMEAFEYDFHAGRGEGRGEGGGGCGGESLGGGLGRAGCGPLPSACPDNPSACACWGGRTW